MNRSEQLLRALIKEAIKQELNEFQVGNFKLPKINIPGISNKNSKETPEQSAAKKTLDGHFSGNPSFKKDDNQIKNLISKLSSEDQKVYNSKLNQKPQTTNQTHTNNNQFGTNRDEYNKNRSDAHADGWYGESKKR